MNGRGFPRELNADRSNKGSFGASSNIPGNTELSFELTLILHTSSACKAIDDEYKCKKKLDSARSGQVIDKRIAHFEKAQRLANEKIELYDSFNYLYHCITGELRSFDPYESGLGS